MSCRYKKNYTKGRQLRLSAVRKPNKGGNLAAWRKRQAENNTSALEGNTSEEYFAISGRRIIDINYFISQVQDCNKHSPFGCTFSDMQILSEKRNGLNTGLKMKCRMCSYTKVFWTENPQSPTMSANSAAVTGIMSIGGGFSNMEEFFSALDIPSMSEKTFIKEQEKISDAWEVTALKEMESAVSEERSLAIQRGDVDSEGISLLTVVVDGSWAKRSYKTNYASLSGVIVRCPKFTFGSCKKLDQRLDAVSYGSNAQKPDLDSETFKIKKEKFINNLAVSKEEAHRILMETALQSLPHLWIEETRKRLTASNFGFVCNRLPHTKCDSIVKRILYSNFESSGMKYGKKHEKDAIEELKKMGIKIKSSGLFIDENLSFLAATPDGLIDDDGTVEIKCPSSCNDLTPEESILKRKITFWTIDKKNNKIKVLKNTIDGATKTYRVQTYMKQMTPERALPSLKFHTTSAEEPLTLDIRFNAREAHKHGEFLVESCFKSGTKTRDITTRPLRQKTVFG
ncbi:hypothetical protein AVEN_175321-1 [Araneus ventricosus]|uniref:Uncharacterized protein n=1 Tax=Araneus ventricosus TaxID=182803 RepID=A0A4Y2GG43_ARAVE|nr:hypothetical protein AVEN_175321-1 [Araneus ventricosus]